MSSEEEEEVTQDVINYNQLDRGTTLNQGSEVGLDFETTSGESARRFDFYHPFFAQGLAQSSTSSNASVTSSTRSSAPTHPREEIEMTTLSGPVLQNSQSASSPVSRFSETTISSRQQAELFTSVSPTWSRLGRCQALSGIYLKYLFCT